MSADKLFRQEALQKLASPERFDEAVQINSRGTWIAVTAFVALALLFGLWSVHGRIPSRVEGQGILLLSGEKSSTQSPWHQALLSRKVWRLRAAVTPEMTIARIEQPDIALRLADMNRRLEILIANRQQALLGVVINEGLATQDLHFVLDGEVGVQVKGAGEVARLGRGEVVGEMYFVDSSPPSATILAHGGARVLAVEKAAIDARFPTPAQGSNTCCRTLSKVN